MAGAFIWASPLGISAALFLLSGALYLFAGVASGLVISGALARAFGPDVGSGALFNTLPYDRIAFSLDRDPVDLLRSDPVLAGLRRLLLLVVSGLLTALGVLVIAMTWFALRDGQAWALIALAVAGLAVIPLWWVALLPYTRAGIPFTPLHVPPFIGVPSTLLLPAVILGWLGLRSP